MIRFIWNIFKNQKLEDLRIKTLKNFYEGKKNYNNFL